MTPGSRGAPDHRGPRGWSSLATRSALLYSALVVGVVLLGGWLVHSGNSRSVRRERERELDHRAGTIEIRFQAELEAVINDLRFLTKMPSVGRLADTAADSPDRPQRLEEVVGNFAALLEGKPSYAQARLLALEGDGSEIIRLDHLDGAIVATRPEDLQEKGHRDYYVESLSLQPGDVYLSKINLNQEHGEVSQPHLPTIRAATKAYRSDGSEYGLMVINVDLRPLFAELRTMAGPAASLYIANREGDYLVHPSLEKTFGFDLGQRFRLQDDFGENFASGAVAREEVVRFRRFPLRPDGEKFYTVGVGVPLGVVLADLNEVRNRSLLATLGVGLAAAALVWTLAMLLARRLTNLADSIENFEPGSGPPHLPDQGNDEVAVVARKFTTMAGKIEDQIVALEEARQAKERFVAHLSHEIRTPLNAVTGMIHSLVNDRPAPHQAAVLEGLDFSARQLLEVTNNVLDYSKIEAGKMSPEPVPFDLPQLLGKVQLTHQPLAEQSGIAFVLDRAADLPRHVCADSLRLFQILGNLVQNALRFTRPGGRVTLHAAPLASDPQRVRFTVEDTGIGMSADDIRRALAPFEQAGPTPAQAARGSGLGLPIAQALVTLLGGTLEIESDPGKGSRIGFTIPMDPADGPLPEPATTPPAIFSDRRILCVEDVASNREVVSALLQATGATLQFAACAAEALDLLQQAEAASALPDVVLLDLQLPDLDGAELATGIRRQWPQLPLIGLTAQTSGELLDRSRAAGIREFVWKPIQPAALLDALRSEFAGHGPQLALDRIRQLFDGQQDRIGNYLRTLHGEWTTAATALPGLCEGPDQEGLHTLHHRLQNGIASVSAQRLATALRDLLGAAATRNGSLDAECDHCLAVFESALHELQDHLDQFASRTP